MSRIAVRAIVRRGDKLLVMRRDKFGDRYYILVGGSMGPGETTEQALERELREETSLKLTSAKPVFKEDAGDIYGTQYIYLCECEGDEPVLAPDSEEAKINALGQNLYTPLWISIEEFKTVRFRSKRLHAAVIAGIEHGFPEKPTLI
jgi:ADP-ribose pyrophosphatase YjhB (NUDIX family)